ncbi:unnamed protein product [Enterobius vermicularis]|uniref:WD_REPEATS_REGION domain-containing protein n=1 Tax=Enterobius vermicularis TaxID=51028 RepID=A0A0N4VA29_ENTVE|nr:unnamed protein product [Enterobius vermicularis]
MAQPYKPLQRFPSEKVESKLSEDVLYWRRMKQLAVFQESGNITSVSFSTSVPNYVASTSSVRLSVFDVAVCEPISVCSRFKEAVYGVTFRKDGKLIAVGSQDGRARVFDVVKQGTILNKAPLRSYKSQGCPIHLIVLGDDGAIRLYDIVETKAVPLKVLESAHADHIRCGDTSKTSDLLFATGSYDHTAKVWNLESEEDKPLVTVDHGAPVESLLFISESSLLATAGGQLIKLWNISVGGKLLYTLHNHHKTVTSLCLASNGNTLLSGGLDKRINVYRLDSGDFSLIHAFTMPAPVFALSVSLNDSFMAVGMGNLLGIFRREAPGPLEATLSEAKLLGKGLEYRRRWVKYWH